MADNALSKETMKRLPAYLEWLKKAQAAGKTHVPSSVVAQSLKRNEVQVRKDLSAVSRHPGKPMTGFAVAPLIEDIEAFLYSKEETRAVLVGAGALGRALMRYPGFAKGGVFICAAFDLYPVSEPEASCQIYPMEKLEDVCKASGARIGIITTPADAAQGVCDALLRCGIQAIWNFAPTFLRVPEGVLVQNEHLSSSAALVAQGLREEEKE